MKDIENRFKIKDEDGEIDALTEILSSFDYIKNGGDSDGAYEYISEILKRVYDNGYSAGYYIGSQK